MTRMTPFPHQIEGAEFLARQTFAVLGDEPRVGKTGAAIMAADMRGARTILVVTTASGRAVWAKGFADWSLLDRPLSVMSSHRVALQPETRVVIVGWPSIGKAEYRTRLLAREWDVLILDECHYSKSFEATRTQAVYGVPMNDGLTLARSQALANRAKTVWCLSGTVMPNSPFDLYPMLRANTPGRLLADAKAGWPDVTASEAFKSRYCTTRPMKIGHGYHAKWVDVITGGKNLPELRDRIAGLILRRTQQDVGIHAPIYETMPLIVAETQRRAVEREAGKLGDLLAAIDKGSTRDLEMHLGPLRRLTGALKADAVADAVIEEFEGGLDRVVLAYWHKEVGARLIERLSKYGVVGIDGATPADTRDKNVRAFQSGKAKVFLGQIAAAGEAIDLSSSAELIFVEPSFIPKDMRQMALRITNHSQARQARVRVATLAGSIDDAIQKSLLRKWSAINEVLIQ